MELSQGSVLVGKPKKGLQKYFHNVVPFAVGDYKGRDAKLPQKDFGNETENTVLIEFPLCFAHSMGTGLEERHRSWNHQRHSTKKL